nr:MerR family transcriptional regulator [Canibacter zhuwentaonis]
MYSPIFAIAQAAELAEMHPQTLRQYDRIGLVQPQRTRGNTRRYSMHNVNQLRRVAKLSFEGMSLAGIMRVFELENQVARLEGRVRELERALADAKTANDRRVFAAASHGEIVSVVRGKRIRQGEVLVWHPKNYL